MSIVKVTYYEYMCHPETCCHNHHNSYIVEVDGDEYGRYSTQEIANKVKEELEYELHNAS